MDITSAGAQFTIACMGMRLVLTHGLRLVSIHGNEAGSNSVQYHSTMTDSPLCVTLPMEHPSRLGTQIIDTLFINTLKDPSLHTHVCMYVCMYVCLVCVQG